MNQTQEKIAKNLISGPILARLAPKIFFVGFTS